MPAPQQRERELRHLRDTREREILLQLQVTTEPRLRSRLLELLIQAGEWRPQIRALCRRWAMPTVTPEELEQAGYLGLLTAAARYQPDLDHHGWATYATLWIRVEVAKLARHSGPLVLETEREIRVARQVGRALKAGASTAEEVVARTGLSLAVVTGAMAGRRSPGWWSVEDERNELGHHMFQQRGHAAILEHAVVETKPEQVDKGEVVRAWLADLRERFG